MSELTNIETVAGCPFCGETTTVTRLHGDHYKHVIACTNDACHATPAVTGAARADAIRRRNTRKAKTPMDRPSCGTCKHFTDVGYKNWGVCTAPAPLWALSEYVETMRQVFRDGSTADLAPDCEAYKPNTRS